MTCPSEPASGMPPWCLFFLIGWGSLTAHLLPAQSIPVSQNWAVSTGGIIFSSPTIDSSGNLFVGSNNNQVHAISSADGSTNWTFTTGNWVDTTPALSHDESIVYFGSWDNKLYAVHVETGAEIWSYETNSFIQSSPAVGLDGKIYFGSMDSIFYALEANGSVAWEYFAGQPIFSSPAIGPDGTLYFGDENGTLHAVNPDGSEKWTYLVDEVADTNKSILSSPAMDGEGNLYFGSGNGYCYSISDDGNQATLNWKYLTGDRVDSSPALGTNDEVFFVSRDGYMRSLPLFSATTENLANWEVLVGDVFYSSPVVDENGRVYVIAYTGGGENHLFAYDANGTKAWDSNVSNPPFTIPSVVDSSLLLSDAGDLYFGCFDQNLYSLSLGLAPANSGWPMFRRNSTRNGDWPNFSLTLQSTPDATGSTTGGGNFYQGTLTTITATPETGYSFNGWVGEGVLNPTSQSTSVSMTQNRSIAATFSINSYDLNVSAGNGGTASGSGSFSHGSTVAISASPDSGYSFNGWVGEGVLNPTSQSTSVSMTQNRSIAATFSIKETDRYLLTITALPSSAGVVSGARVYDDQSIALISASATNGYTFTGWSGNGITNLNLPETSVFMDRDRNITANFIVNSYDLNLSTNEGGNVSGGGSFTFDSHSTILATPSTGYSFTGWVGEGVDNPNALSTSVHMTKDRNISASFSLISHSLTLLPADGGTVSGAGTFYFGSSPTISATPSTGYSFTGWIGEGVFNPNALSTSVHMTKDRNISASFSLTQLSQNLEVSNLGNNWFSSWLGTVYQTESEWIYHLPLGWLYPQTMESSLWLWSEEHQWIWVEKESFSENFIWLGSIEEWVYLDLSSPTAPRYYNYQSESWASW